MTKCSTCRKDQEEAEFYLMNGKRRKQCKTCRKRAQVHYNEKKRKSSLLDYRLDELKAIEKENGWLRNRAEGMPPRIERKDYTRKHKRIVKRYLKIIDERIELLNTEADEERNKSRAANLKEYHRTHRVQRSSK